MSEFERAANLQAGVPIISLQDTMHDSPSTSGASSKAVYIPSSSMGSTQHGNAASLAGFTDVLQRRSEASGVVPQLSLNVGRCGMDGAMGFALSDFAVTVKPTHSPFLCVGGKYTDHMSSSLPASCVVCAAVCCFPSNCFPGAGNGSAVI